MTRDKLLLIWVASIPVFNILMDIGMNFLPELKTIFGLVRISFLIGLVLFFLSNFKLQNIFQNQLIIFFSLYLMGISILSSNTEISFIDGAIKTSLPFFMIPIGITVSKMKSNLLIKPFVWVIIILLINYLISQFYKLGVSVYEKDSFYTGGATASAPIIIALGLLVIFHSFNQKKLPYNKIIITLIVSSALFIIVFSLKRGAILALISGVIIYLFNTGQRIQTIGRFIIVGLLMVFLLNNNIETFYKRFDSRTTERNDLQNEGRFKEIFYIIEEFQKSPPLKILFGTEPFNSDVVMVKYFGRKRRLHVDYNILIHGTGIIGLIIYFLLYYSIFRTALKHKRRFFPLKKSIYHMYLKENYALVTSVLILSLIMGFSGGLQFVSYRIMLFLTIGYYLGDLIHFKSKLMAKSNAGLE
tara:strand:+ start:1954 stop:3198 length:1245 start_codon:yes stop_codon:yes gene_type:complete